MRISSISSISSYSKSSYSNTYSSSYSSNLSQLKIQKQSIQWQIQQEKSSGDNETTKQSKIKQLESQLAQIESQIERAQSQKTEQNDGGEVKLSENNTPDSNNQNSYIGSLFNAFA